MKISKVNLSEYSSLKIGGVANFLEIKTEDEIKDCLVYAKTEGFRVHILGDGTNTFFANDLKNLLVLKICLKGTSLKDDGDSVLVNAKAGENWDDLVKFTMENNLWGLENLSLIPGSVGAAPVQNIGAYGVELKDVLDSVGVYDCKENKFLILKNEECDFNYRDSLFKKSKGRYIICDITIKLSKRPNPRLDYAPLNSLKGVKDLKVSDVRDLVLKVRREKLPDYKIYPNAGSFFKNVIVDENKLKSLQEIYPDIIFFKDINKIKIPTAWLIENVAKMKGVKIGSVGTWPSQPLVIVNYGTGYVQELLDFEKEIKKIIFEKTGIELEREVNYVS